MLSDILQVLSYTGPERGVSREKMKCNTITFRAQMIPFNSNSNHGVPGKLFMRCRPTRTPRNVLLLDIYLIIKTNKKTKDTRKQFI